MASFDAGQPRLDPENTAALHQAHDCAPSVLNAYTAALDRRLVERDAFDAAVRTYLLYHPNMPERAARLAVARIVSWKE
jgi:hypothetical protein